MSSVRNCLNGPRDTVQLGTRCWILQESAAFTLLPALIINSYIAVDEIHSLLSFRQVWKDLEAAL